jgi:TolA-binding protein
MNLNKIVTLSTLCFSMVLAFPLFGQSPSVSHTGPELRSAAAGASGGGGGFSFQVLPDVNIPMGSDAEFFDPAYGTSIFASWIPSSLPFLFLGLGASYSFMPTKAPDMSLSTEAVAAQGGVQFHLSRALSMQLRGEGGYFFAAQNGASGTSAKNPYWSSGVGLDLEISRNFAAQAGASWRSWHGLVSGVGINIGMVWRTDTGSGRKTGLPPGFTPIINEGRGLGFAGAQLDSVFPIFYKHYDDHPIGRIVLRNFETSAATDIKAWVNVKRYMDEAKPAGVPLKVVPGASGEILLYGLFTDSILEITEATKLPVSVTLEYSQYGKTYRDEYVGTLDVLDRNAITWDDDRKAAAFISSKDPEALTWSKTVATAIKDLMNLSVNQNLQATMAVHETLRIQKFTYLKDPSSALETNNKQVVDFIQFPRQTLGFRSGKCSDLTVLYCSLLEAIGVSTALITTPGHIFMAVDLEMDPGDVGSVFNHPNDLIIREGKVWLPIETTERSEDFIYAWREGARQWRDASAKKTSAFIPVRDAWKEYQPVAYSAGGKIVAPPDVKASGAAFKAELSTLIAGELGPRVAALQAELAKKGGSPTLYNRLGLLYARYGQFEKAQEQFAAAIKSGKNNLPAVFNLGNIMYLRGNYTEALSYYSKVLTATPGNPKALLAISRVHAALGKYAESLAYYERLKRADPALAANFAFLGAGPGDGTRAAEAEKLKRNVPWQD